MKTDEAVQLFKNAARLARKLGITPSAVYQWGAEVPRLREYEIKELVAQGKHLESDEEIGPQSALPFSPAEQERGAA